MKWHKFAYDGSFPILSHFIQPSLLFSLSLALPPPSDKRENLFFCDFCGETLLLAKRGFERESVLYAFGGSCPSCESRLDLSLKMRSEICEKDRSFLIHPRGKPAVLNVRLPLEAFLTGQKFPEQESTTLTRTSSDIFEALRQSLNTDIPIFLQGENSHTVVTEFSVETVANSTGDNPQILFLDGGNCFDPYLFAETFTLKGFSCEEELDYLLVSRAFNLYQYTSLVCNILPNFMKKCRPSLIVLLEPEELYCEKEIEEKEAVILFSQVTREMTCLAGQKMAPILATSKSIAMTGRRARLQKILRQECHVLEVLDKPSLNNISPVHLPSLGQVK